MNVSGWQSPPEHVIKSALEEAVKSPCAKSRRGAVVCLVNENRYVGNICVFSYDYNRPPAGVSCDASPACMASCGRRCLHAEALALDGIQQIPFVVCRGISMADCDLVHVKAGPGGKLVAGGGPSCVPCAVKILDVGLGGVWLYQTPDSTRDLLVADIVSGVVRFDPRKVIVGKSPTRHAEDGPAWVRYTAEAFHRITMRACGVY